MSHSRRRAGHLLSLGNIQNRREIWTGKAPRGGTIQTFAALSTVKGSRVVIDLRVAKRMTYMENIAKRRKVVSEMAALIEDALSPFRVCVI